MGRVGLATHSGKNKEKENGESETSQKERRIATSVEPGQECMRVLLIHIRKKQENKWGRKQHSNTYMCDGFIGLHTRTAHSFSR